MKRALRHALATWIAALAMLFAALAPSLSHAFASAAPALDFPICSAAGHAGPEIKPGTFDLGPDPFKHCPYCTDGHHAPGLLAAPPASLLTSGGAVLPTLFYTAPAPLFQWAAPQSRAPPSVS